VIHLEDELTGRGRAAVELRFPLAALPCAPRPEVLPHLARLFAEGFDPQEALELHSGVVLVRLAGPRLDRRLAFAPVAPTYGGVRRGALVVYSGLLTLPVRLRHALVMTEDPC
jgi:hypothetical protein